MAIRLLPFRQYNETDVINLFALEMRGVGNVGTNGLNQMDDPFATGANDAGILVKITAGDMNDDPIVYETRSYLGKTDYPNVGRNQYPVNPLKVQMCNSGDAAFGVTLRQTLTHDENGEKLIYYPQKAEELYAVQTGQTVPVLTRGLITVNHTAIDGLQQSSQSVNVGTPLMVGDRGQFAVKSGMGDLAQPIVGTVLASGSRVTVTTKDYYAGDPNAAGKGGSSTGNYYVIKFDCQNVSKDSYL